jgi:uncharacterized membrane protein
MKTSLRIPYQFLTAAMGALLLLPLHALSLPILLTLPGLAFFLLYRGAKHTDVLEVIAYSLSLSLILVSVAATIVYFLGVSLAATSVVFGLAIIATSALSLAVRKGKASPREVEGPADKRHRRWVRCALPILLALALALIVSVPLSKSLVVGDEGLVMNPTEAGDLNFHLSILARFAESPRIPPEDPYLPSHYVVYDFFTHVYVGTLATLTGVSTLTIFKITVPFLLFALSMNIYVLCSKTFNNAAALVAMILYALGGGLAWIAIVAQRPTDVFPYLIYHFTDAAAIKYDQTLLFYLLPQPQAFALVILTFAFILWITLIKKLNKPNALLFGLTLGLLPYYHLITAFPLFAALAVYVVYQYARGRALHAQHHLGALAVGGAIASPLLLLTAGPNQVGIAFSTYSLFFMLIVYGLIGILAFIGAYRSLNNEAAKPLLIFALCAFIAMNVVSLPLTNNSYRFLVYLWLPIALFASYYISTVIAKANGERLSSKKRMLKIAAVIAAVFLALPTSYALWRFYDKDTYVLASPDELQAAQWIKTNTSKDAIFFEEPSTFPRIPFTTGRMVAFAGAIYTIQYHGINLQNQTDALMNERSPALLDLGLRQLNVSYVFIGSHERGYTIATTVNNSSYFERVYSNPTVNIYKLKE